MAVGGLNGGGRGAGAVEALGTALTEGLDGHAEEEEAAEPEPAEPAFFEEGLLEAGGERGRHWPNSRRRKRKIQSTPMTCQYQTVVSTKT